MVVVGLVPMPIVWRRGRVLLVIKVPLRLSGEVARASVFGRRAILL